MKPSVRLGLLGLFVAFAAVLGATQFGGVASAQVPAGTTKTCTPAAPAPGATFTCTVAVPASPAAAVGVAAYTGYTITVAGATVTGATCAPAPAGAAAGCAATVTPPATIVVTCTAGGAAVVCPATTTTETLTAGAAGTTITETFTMTPAAGAPAPTAATIAPAAGPIVVAAAVTNITLGGCVAATGTTPPTIPGTGAPAAGTTTTTITAGQAVTCRILFSDNDAVPAAVASGIVSVTLSGATGGAVPSVSGAGNPGGAGPASTVGNTTTIRCGAPGVGAANPEGCSFLDVSFTTSATTPLGGINLTVSYTPDLPALNTSANVSFSPLVTVVQAIAAFAPPTALTISCPAALNPGIIGALPTLTPGPIGGVTVAGVGILPAALTCQVLPTPNPSAPGTIEVSSLNGVLLDANGQLTTNLRIPCGSDRITLTPGAPLVTNNCAGVQFAVLGQNVGFVELRARYEPTPAVAAAGGVEIETSTSVAFIAPAVTLSSLDLNPNPVAKGGTGTATVRFNRTVLICGLNGVFCVNPTTGLPIAIERGSQLNGNVVFTIDNTAIASWAGTQPTAAALPASTSGTFITTANQTIVRCGFFPTRGAPASGFPSTTGSLVNFFGGCDSAAATYQGNEPGVANVTATFVPDLPGAFGTSLIPGVSQSQTALLGAFGGAVNPSITRTLEVVAAAPVTNLVRGCNNVSPTIPASEPASAYAARVTPTGALVAIWEYQAATNTFKGFSPQAGAPNDLDTVRRLIPVFVCVNAAAKLDQPPL